MKCQPGDLAMVLRTENHPDGVGRIVEVVEPAPTETFETPEGVPGAAPGPNWWIIFIPDSPHEHSYYIIADENLMLIRPEPDQTAECSQDVEQDLCAPVNWPESTLTGYQLPTTRAWATGMHRPSADPCPYCARRI